MTTAFKWVCTISAILIGMSTVGAIGTPELTSPAGPGADASPTLSDVVETAYASNHLSACAFAALVGCF